MIKHPFSISAAPAILVYYHRPKPIRYLLFPFLLFNPKHILQKRGLARVHCLSLSPTTRSVGSSSLPPGVCHSKDVANLLALTVQHSHKKQISSWPRRRQRQRQLRRWPLRAFAFVPGAILQTQWVSRVISAVFRLELVITTRLVHGHRPAWSS